MSTICLIMLNIEQFLLQGGSRDFQNKSSCYSCENIVMTIKSVCSPHHLA